MMRALIIALLLLPGTAAISQVIFRTIIPRQPIVAGESFPVQYVLEAEGKDDGFTPPLFNGLQVVSGPDIYAGQTLGIDGPIALKNIVYTLVATRAGWITIHGASALRNGKTIRSNDVLIEVISKQEMHERTKGESEGNSEYILKPGEDPYQKMKDNLYLRVSVDRNQCFIGQPVLATFKLYSRLESRSDIVKNPGFYGFTVHDILNLNDKHSVTEVINGKAFDVHTVRMVQLYPLQAGDFVIDPMEVVNQVEFSRSVVNKKTEQKIIEGVFERNPAKSAFNTVSYENSISTKPVSIRVKPFPEKNKPTSFNGATGNFSISASFDRDTYNVNEQGTLVVTFDGQGNFVQLDAPRINWPEGIEGFAPLIQDSLDKSFSPLKGSRTFRFPFVASKKGSFTIPAISLTFFNPDTNLYRTVATTPLHLDIRRGQKHAQAPAGSYPKPNHGSAGRQWIWVAAGIVTIGIFLLFRHRKMRKKQLTMETAMKVPPPLSIEDEFLPAIEAFRINDAAFYSILQQCTWNCLQKALGISTRRMTREELIDGLRKRNIPSQYLDELAMLMGQCEMANFTAAEPTIGKRRLLFRVKEVIRQITAVPPAA